MLGGEEHAAEQAAELLGFVRFLAPLVFAFAALEAAAALWFGDASTGLVALYLLVYGIVVIGARGLAARGAVRRAAAVMCAGFFVSTIATVFSQPSLTPTLALTPLLSVGLALPHAGDRLLAAVSVLAWAVTLAVGVLGEVLEDSSTLPEWYGSFFRVASLATASGIVLLLLWQFRTRLNDAAMARVRRAEERYALAERGANDGLFDWYLNANAAYFSARFEEMAGLGEGGLGGDPSSWTARIHPDERGAFEEALASHLRGRTAHFQSEHRLRQEDGSYRWVLARGRAVRGEDGEPHRMAGSLTDVTERHRMEARSRYDASHDALTGLPNRALLVERLAATMGRARKDPSHPYAVLFLDLDRFKNVNDSLGHAVGDELLKVAARRLSSCVRPADTVARLGGDEFVVLLEGASAPEAEGLAGRVQEALKAPVKLHGHELYATASIGVVVRPEGHDGPEELLRDADTAMYKAKGSGKARHAVFDAGMRREAVSLLRLETDLRCAVERGEFVVFYQPIVWLPMGGVVGFEALVRWEHPERGLLTPNAFVPLAEETGLIREIDRFVLGEACRRAASWRERYPDRFPPSVSVNLSPSGLSRPSLVEEVEAVLKAAGLPGRALALELTEGAVLGDPEEAVAVLGRLRKLGVRVHIDDFGTGHSSLALLHRLPVDALKIDRSFVARLVGDLGVRDDTPAGLRASPAEGEGAEIVRTVATLAHGLGMDVVAEGVETDGQLRLLREMGCDYAQGFRFSRPVPPEGVGAILSSDATW